MTDRAVRNLEHLRGSASTARVLNLLRVWEENGDSRSDGAVRNPDWAARPVFRTHALNRSLIIKHRLRRNETDLFTGRRQVATKVVIPIDDEDLKTGGRYVFVNQIGFERMMIEAFGVAPTHPDIETLRLIDKLPSLKVVGEHITTETAAVFIESAPDTVAATVTPQHLLYTVGHLLKGCNYHLYCLPLVKYASDREALRAAVTMPGQRKFFAGTDSAPHTTKATACGCAAGCYTGGIAPQLYAEGFEAAYADLESEEGVETFTRFLCLNGPEFYGLKAAPGTFTLVREPQSVAVTEIPGGGTVMPLPLGLGHDSIGWRIETA